MRYAYVQKMTKPEMNLKHIKNLGVCLFSWSSSPTQGSVPYVCDSYLADREDIPWRFHVNVDSM